MVLGPKPTLGKEDRDRTLQHPVAALPRPRLPDHFAIFRATGSGVPRDAIRQALFQRAQRLLGTALLANQSGMPKLFFNYSTMNAGKSTVLLQASHNYRENGMETYLLTARFDDRAGQGRIASRIGIGAEADTFNTDTDLFETIKTRLAKSRVACVFVDEAQFLTKAQVWQLAHAVDDLSVPVMCYGLRVDFRGELFPGSAALLAIADEMREVRTICFCGKKATMVVRKDDQGRVLTDGDQVQIGGNETYVSLCRKHWREAMGYRDPD